MQGRVFSSAAYRYGFNGKEEETDGTADNYDFGARIYDGRLGRWLAVDPKFRKYVDAGVYNFSACSPLAVNDPSGGEINITFNSHYDSKTKVTTVDVKIVITGKVLQNSHSEVSAKEVANFVNSEVIRLFNNKTINFDNGVIWNVQAESHFTEAKTMDEVAESDHLIAIVDDAEGKTASGKEIAYFGVIDPRVSLQIDPLKLRGHFELLALA